MDRQAILSELKNMIGEYLNIKGLDLVDLIYRYEGRNFILRILVDKPEGGINLDECADLNNEISRILNEKDILQERYILEVSSPGIDMPLKTKNDFSRCTNRKVRLFFTESINGKMELAGQVTKVVDDTVYISLDDECFPIPLSKIAKAKQIIANA